MIKSIKDYKLDSKKVIIRCDLNVPIKDGTILDDNRIKESLKTIKYAVDNNAKVIILSHLGRIKTKEDLKSKSLKIVCERLSSMLGVNVKFIGQTRGRAVEDAVFNLKNKEVLLLENTRFEDYPNKYESNNDYELGKYWASLGDIFINDAFATSHRAHASNVGIASNINSGIGFLVEKEINILSSIKNNPKKPFLVIMGGSKISDKIKVIDKLINKADYILLGGGIANTFLKAKGIDIKSSIYDKDSIDFCCDMISKYGNKIILPLDGYGSSSFEDNLSVEYSSINNILDNIMLLDIGPKTIELFKKYIDLSETIFWNGPVGVFEFHNFEYGTKSLLKILKESNKQVIIGGGDSASAAIRFGYKNSFSHISTGGGASLEFIEGKTLPAIDVIDKR